MSAYKDKRYGHEYECCNRRYHDVTWRSTSTDSYAPARMLPSGRPDPVEQAHVETLRLASYAECRTCGKRFEGTKRLLGGEIGLTHMCSLGHDVQPASAGERGAK